MRDAAFKAWLMRRFPKQGTWSTYLSDCRRVDSHSGDLDDHYREDGLKSVLAGFAYSKRDGIEPTHTIPQKGDPYTAASAFSAAVKNYRIFCEETSDIEEGEWEPKNSSQTEERGLVFSLESDLQSALRDNLSQLETGLREADGGLERTVSSGRIDITAQDAEGNLPAVSHLSLLPADAIDKW